MEVVDNLWFTNNKGTVGIGEPLSAREIVERNCAPYNARVSQAWDKCVEAARLANICTHVAQTYTRRAVRYTSLARQYHIVARLAGTAPWDGIPTVAIN